MSATRIGGLGERELVRRILAGLGGPAADRVIVGAGDDAAVVRTAGAVVLTVDTQREGSHFERGWLSAADLGRRALAVSVSDLAAMGARPLCSLCALALPADLDAAWIDELSSGLRAAGAEFGCPVVGGDVTRSPAIGLCVTAVGELPEGRAPVLRSGAVAGDDLLVAGALGMAAAGRLALRAGRELEFPEAVQAYRRPQPLTALALQIAPACHAMMDISDGLAIDLARLGEASGVGARVNAVEVVTAPLQEVAAALRVQAEELALAGGDDYALLLAVPPARREEVARSARACGVPLRRVGTATGTPALLLRQADGTERDLGAGGWDPFAGRSA